MDCCNLLLYALHIIVLFPVIYILQLINFTASGFSLLINSAILLLDCLVLIVYFYIHFLYVRCYFLYLALFGALYMTETTLKVSKSLYCFTTSITHGVENYFPRLVCTGILDAIFFRVGKHGCDINEFTPY